MKDNETFKKIETFYAKTQFGTAVRVRLYKKLASLLRNGVPLVAALKMLHKQESKGGKKKDDPVSLILADFISVIENGGAASKAFAPWIPLSESMLIQAGEKAGDLPGALSSAIEVMQSSSQMKSALTGGLAYPLMLLVAAMGVVFLFGSKVIPEFAKIIDPSKWQGGAKGMLIMSNIVRDWTIPVIVLIVGVIVAIVYSMSRWRGGGRIFADNIPPWSIYRLWQGSTFLMSLQALLKAGVPLEKALIEMQRDANPWLDERIHAMIVGLRSGLSFGDALQASGYGFPDSKIIDEITIYSSLSGFDKALAIISKEWLVEGVIEIQAKANMLRGIAMAVMAGVVAGLAAGMISIQQLLSSGVSGAGA